VFLMSEIPLYVTQSGPDYGLGFYVKVLKTFYVIPASLGNGYGNARSWKAVQQFRGGLVFKAHRLLHDSTLGLRVIKKKNAGTPRHQDARRGVGVSG